MFYSTEYDPIQVGSIDGTDIDPHDHAIIRASLSSYEPPKYLKSDPNCTLFVSRLNFDTTDSTLKEFFDEYGEIVNIELVRNNVTGLSQGYGFITFKDSKSTQEAYRDAHERTLDNHVILVDYERSRLMKGWIPRRFGGGYGGKKESGQLRFGGRDKPFKRPPADSDLRVDYDQKRSDCWRQADNNRSSSRIEEERRLSKSLARESSRRHDDESPSREKRRHRSSSRSRRNRLVEREVSHHVITTSIRHRHRKSRSREDRYCYRSRSREHHDYSTGSKRYHDSDKHHRYSSDHKRKRYNKN